MKKVLLISYVFPPVGGIGVQRNLKFVKYLPKMGWQPFVLTIKPEYFLLYDESLIKDIPQEASIFETDCLKPKQKTFSWQKSALENNSNFFNKTIKLICKFIEKELIIPDIWAGWLPFALAKSNKIIKQNKIKIIFCTGPSFTSFLVGFLISKKFKLPLVLDYRDGWLLDTRRKTSSINAFKNTIDYYLEKIILSHASKVIFISDHLLSIYCQKFKSIENKSIVISNGFDPCDLDKNNTNFIKKEASRFVISHIGGCDPLTRKPLIILFLDLLNTVINNNPEIKTKFKLKFVGIVPLDIKEQTKKCHLDDIIEIEDFVPRKKALELMQNSDALLLFTDLSPNNKAVLTGKLFEYLMVHKPILAFAPKEGAASHVIKETRSGIVIDCETQTKKEMLDSITSFVKKILNEEFEIKNQHLIEKYHREKLTKSLAEILEKTTSSN